MGDGVEAPTHHHCGELLAANLFRQYQGCHRSTQVARCRGLPVGVVSQGEHITTHHYQAEQHNQGEHTTIHHYQGHHDQHHQAQDRLSDICRRCTVCILVNTPHRQSTQHHLSLNACRYHHPSCLIAGQVGCEMNEYQSPNGYTALDPKGAHQNNTPKLHRSDLLI
jgi:hypothetical protein